MASRSEKLIESLNELSSSELCDRFFSTKIFGAAEEIIQYNTGLQLSLRVLFSNELSVKHRMIYDECFALLEQSSARDYQKSELKWSATKKRKEMLLPDMRYLVVLGPTQSSDPVDPPTHETCGFVSFMFTYEDGHEVIYIYEIHLAPELRKQGVGKSLLSLVEDTGRIAGVEKCMLTVFKANQGALRWYERCDYTTDDFSPGPRVLRNGTVKEPSYLILSKQLRV